MLYSTMFTLRSIKTSIDELDKFATRHKSFGIILEAKVMLTGGHQVLFEKCF